MNIQELMSKRGGKPLDILVVDDEENVRDVFRDFCESSPIFKVSTAASGNEAVELTKTEHFDLVTIDLVMPEMSGLEAIEMIKRQNPHLPVVIVTGNATEDLIRQAGNLGGCRVLHKPVSIEDFLEELIDVAEEKCGR